MRYLQIQTTNRCNAVCQFCPHTVSLAKHPETMTPEVFGGVMKALEGHQWDRIMAYCQAEPMMDPDIFERIAEMCRRLKSRTIEFSTNLELFDLDALAKLAIAVGGKPTVLAMSFQGTNSWDFEGATGIPWDPCYANLKAILQATDSMPWRRSIRCICGGPNADEWFRRRFAEWGIKPESVRVVTSPPLSRCGNVPGTRTVYRVQDKFLNCGRLSLWAHVAVDGQLLPCCDDYNRECLLGNVLDTPLDELFLGIHEKMRVLSREPGQFLCHRCPREVCS